MQRNCLKTQTEKITSIFFRNTEKKVSTNSNKYYTIANNFFCGMRKTSFICIKIALTKLKTKTPI